MKIYLLLDNKLITGYSLHVISGAPEVDIADPSIIKLGLDTFEGGHIVSHAKPQSQINYERIVELKKLLNDSDYVCLKHADGELTDEEYATVKAQRHAWREEIRQLEEE